MTDDAHNPFGSNKDETDLLQSTVRAGKVTFLAQAANFSINVVSLAVLARLLTPGDFGLIAMVTAVTGIAGMLKDAGLSVVTVQRETVTHEQVSTLFWMNIGISGILSIIIGAAAPTISWFYGDARLVSVSIALAFIFLFGGLAVQHQALLRRQMRFGALARIQIISSVAGLSIAILGAVNAAGYWALVMQMAVSEITSLLMTWAHCRWVPTWPKRGVGTRSMLKTGGFLTGFSFLNYFARNADNILVGKVWGVVELGSYAKAYSLLLMPIQQINGPISAVATPALSRLQNHPQEFRAMFCKILSAVGIITFPLIAFIIICSREIILTLLGDQWTAAVPIFSALAISGFFQPVGNITGILYVSLGRAERMFRWGMMSSSWIVASFLVGLPFGALGVALSYSLAITLMMPLLIYYAIEKTDISVLDFVESLRKPTTYTIFASILGMVVHSYMRNINPHLIVIAATGVAMMFTYAASMYLLGREQFNSAKKILLGDVGA